MMNESCGSSACCSYLSHIINSSLRASQYSSICVALHSELRAGIDLFFVLEHSKLMINTCWKTVAYNLLSSLGGQGSSEQYHANRHTHVMYYGT